MPMREECRHFQSRTYRSGEVARWCSLDLAPEAPWRCPSDCPRYSPRKGDAGWSFGTLTPRPTPEEPEIIELNDEAAALLDQAENIVNAVGPVIVADVQEERSRRARPTLFDRLRMRFRRR